MRLSMWILADWLKKYNPQLKILDGKRVLRNARMSSETTYIENSTVYVGKAQDFINIDQNKVICVHGHDIIFLDSEDVNEVFNYIMDAFDYYNSWSDSIKEKLKLEHSQQEMLNDTYSKIGGIWILIDETFFVYALSGVKETGIIHHELKNVINENMMSLESILIVNQNKDIRLHKSQSYIIDFSSISLKGSTRNLFLGNKPQGWLTYMKPQGDITHGDLDIQDELGDIIEHWMALHPRPMNLREQAKVFIDILEGTYSSSEEIHRRLESFHWKWNDPVQVFIIQKKTENNISLEILESKLKQLTDYAFTLQHMNNILLILNRNIINYESLYVNLENLLKSSDYVCGFSPIFSNIFDIKNHIEIATVAALYSSNTEKIMYNIKDAILNYCINLISKGAHIEVVHPALKILSDYDAIHGTMMFKTLEEYLRCERNLVKTATALYIHRNSLVYRIERIQELIGEDLNASEVRLHIQISYKLWYLR